MTKVGLHVCQLSNWLLGINMTWPAIQIIFIIEMEMSTHVHAHECANSDTRDSDTRGMEFVIIISYVPMKNDTPCIGDKEVQLLQTQVSPTQIQKLSVKVKEHDQELSAMKKEVDLLLSEVHALKEITDELRLEPFKVKN